MAEREMAEKQMAEQRSLQEEQMERRLQQQREEYELKTQRKREQREQREHDQKLKLREQERARAAEVAQRLKLEQQRKERLEKTTPSALRDVRNLIRTRYELDTFIWSLKGARGPDRPIVLEKMDKADAVLQQILTMVDTWEENNKLWTPEEWILARRIKGMIQAEGKRWWADNPPWNET